MKCKPRKDAIVLADFLSVVQLTVPSSSLHHHTCTTRFFLLFFETALFSSSLTSSAFLHLACLVVPAVTGSAGISSFSCSCSIVGEQEDPALCTFTSKQPAASSWSSLSSGGGETCVTDQTLFYTFPNKKNNSHSNCFKMNYERNPQCANSW